MIDSFVALAALFFIAVAIVFFGGFLYDMARAKLIDIQKDRD